MSSRKTATGFCIASDVERLPAALIFLSSCSIPDDHISPSAICVFHGKISSARPLERSATILIHHHKQVTTTPKVRAAIQVSAEPASVLVERFGTTEQTVYKWRHRDSVHDRSHTPHRLQTTLTPAQEAVAVALRRALLVSIDDLLALAIGLEPMAPPMARCGSS